MLAFLPETRIFIVTQGEWPPKGDDMTPDGEKPEAGRRKFQAWEACSLRAPERRYHSTTNTPAL